MVGYDSNYIMVYILACGYLTVFSWLYKHKNILTSHARAHVSRSDINKRIGNTRLVRRIAYVCVIIVSSVRLVVSVLSRWFINDNNLYDVDLQICHQAVVIA